MSEHLRWYTASGSICPECAQIIKTKYKDVWRYTFDKDDLPFFLKHAGGKHVCINDIICAIHKHGEISIEEIGEDE